VTVIAWDGRTLAVDRQRTHGDLRRSFRKLRVFDGGMMAATGPTSDCLMMLKWYADGADPEAMPKGQQTEDWSMLVVVRKRGPILQYDTNPLPVEIRRRTPWAWGSGREIALGALGHGATAIEAVKIANRYRTDCGMGVDWHTL